MSLAGLRTKYKMISACSASHFILIYTVLVESIIDAPFSRTMVVERIVDFIIEQYKYNIGF